MSRIKVSWRGEAVGLMEDPTSDMWYLEGRWLPGDGPQAEEFLRVTQGLDPEECMREGAGIAVELTQGDGKPIVALVMSAPGETIFVRQVFDERAKEMILKRERGDAPREGAI